MSMLAHVISRIPREFGIVVGLRPAHLSYLRDFRGEVRRIETTSGQASTVLQMARTINPLDSVTVMDCDTLLEQEDICELGKLVTPGHYDAAVAVGMCTQDTAMSRVDQIPFPTLFVEKRYISQWGMVSARSFARPGELARVLSEIVREHEAAGREPYLSEALNRYPGKKIAHVVTRWTDWGTPEKVRSSGAHVATEELR